ncbi:hypothetical protein ILYODFUR_003241 [Ilyodon furcidens]|uniref:Uncharacterized protein n=1 Tax=Ilyodon furcidens TaxID=33524 RepID=A0ABV0U2B3_9TELE
MDAEDEQNLDPLSISACPRWGVADYLQLSLGKRWDTPWTGGSRRTWRELMHARGEHAYSMWKEPRPGFKPRHFLLPTRKGTF